VPVKNFLNAAEVPAVTTFRWTAKDFISDMLLFQNPDSVQWAFTAVPGGQDYPFTIDYLASPAGAKEWRPWVLVQRSAG
jgi:hypothetical protein